MTPRISCPKCDTVLSLKNPTGEKPIKCPKCAHVFKPTSAGNKNDKPDRDKETATKRKHEKETRRKNTADTKKIVDPKLDDSTRENDEPANGSKHAESSRPRLATLQRSKLLPFVVLGVGVLVVLGGGFAVGAWYAWQGSQMPGPERDMAAQKPDLKQESGEPKPADKKTELPEKLSPERLAAIKDATVLIHVGLLDGASASGSGFFLAEPDLICTNAHVVGMLHDDSKAPKQIQVVIRGGEKNEQRVDGKVVAVDRDADLALVRIAEGAGPKPLPLSEPPAMQVTQRIYIFGYPFGDALGKQATVSESSISNLRTKSGELQDIQVNGGIHPGNSGGPVVDAGGNLLGVSVSMIRGTQINFAVPAHKTLDLMEGSVLVPALDETSEQAGKYHAPMRLELVNPMGRIAKVAVEYWVGEPGPARPGGGAAGKALPSDGAKASADFHFQPKDDFATGALILDRLPAPEKVLWCQPVITNKAGVKRWGAAVARTVPGPTTPRDITLVRKYEPGVQSLLVKVTWASKNIQGDAAGRVTVITSETRMHEEIKKAGTPEANYRLRITGASVSASRNGQEFQLDQRLGLVLYNSSRAFIDVRADEQGNFVDLKSDVSTVVSTPPLMEKFLEHVSRALELTAVPVTGAPLKVGQTWRGARRPTMGALEPGKQVSFDLLYTYRGIRAHDRRDAAVIAIEGSVRKNLDFQEGEHFDGTLKAQALIDLANGQIVLFDGSYRLNRKLKLPIGDIHDTQDSVDVYFARNRSPFEPPTGPIAGLPGAWCVTKKIDGGEVQRLFTDKEDWWIFQGDTILFTNNESKGMMTQTRYRLRPDIGPDAVDFEMNSSGSNTVSPKTWHPARFAIEGKVLTFCLSLDPKVRPTEFTSNPNSLRRLYILERVDGWKFGYHRKAIHVAAKEPRPDDGFKDDPNKRLAIDAPSQSAPAPGYDLSPGMQIAHSFRFRDGVALPRLSANGNVIVCLVDKTVQCLDPLTRRVISQITPPGAAWVSPDGTQVAVFTDKPLSIRMCEVATGKTLKTIELLSNPWVPIIFSPGGRYLIGVNRGVDLRIWDTVEGRQVRRIDVPIFSVDISSDGRFLVGSDDKKVYLYDFASLRLEREFPFGANSAIFSPDGKLIYAAAGPRIMTLDRATGARLADYSPDRPMDGGLWVSRDHKHLIGITQVQHGAAVFQVGSPKLMAGFYLPLNASIAHPGRAVFEQNGNEVLLLCSKFDPALKGTAAPAPDDVSKLPAFKITERFKVAVPGLPMPYFGVTAFSPNGKYVLTSTRDKQVKIYDTAVGKLVKTITTNFDQVTGLAMSSDDYIYIGGGIGRLVPGGFNQSPTYIAKYHLSTSKEDRILGLVGAFKGLKLSPDGTRLYGIGIDFSLRVWDVKTRAQLHAWEKLFRVPKSLEISPDGKTGLMVMDSGPVVLNLENFRDVLKLPEGTHEMCMIGDGSKAAMISKNITLKIWDLKTGNVYRSVDLVDRDSPKSFGVERSSKDGKLLYITGQLGGEDFYHIYDIDAGKFVYRYQLPGERNQRFTAPDGAAVVVRSLDALRGLELPPLPKR